MSYTLLRKIKGSLEELAQREASWVKVEVEAMLGTPGLPPLTSFIFSSLFYVFHELGFSINYMLSPIAKVELEEELLEWMIYKILLGMMNNQQKRGYESIGHK